MSVEMEILTVQGQRIITRMEVIMTVLLSSQTRCPLIENSFLKDFNVDRTLVSYRYAHGGIRFGNDLVHGVI